MKFLLMTLLLTALFSNVKAAEGTRDDIFSGLPLGSLSKAGSQNDLNKAEEDELERKQLEEDQLTTVSGKILQKKRRDERMRGSDQDSGLNGLSLLAKGVLGEGHRSAFEDAFASSGLATIFGNIYANGLRNAKDALYHIFVADAERDAHDFCEFMKSVITRDVVSLDVSAANDANPQMMEISGLRYWPLMAESAEMIREGLFAEIANIEEVDPYGQGLFIKTKALRRAVKIGAQKRAHAKMGEGKTAGTGEENKGLYDMVGEQLWSRGKQTTGNEKVDALRLSSQVALVAGKKVAEHSHVIQRALKKKQDALVADTKDGSKLQGCVSCFCCCLQCVTSEKTIKGAALLASFGTEVAATVISHKEKAGANSNVGEQAKQGALDFVSSYGSSFESAKPKQQEERRAMVAQGFCSIGLRLFALSLWAAFTDAKEKSVLFSSRNQKRQLDEWATMIERLELRGVSEDPIPLDKSRKVAARVLEILPLVDETTMAREIFTLLCTTSTELPKRHFRVDRAHV